MENAIYPFLHLIHILCSSIWVGISIFWVLYIYPTAKKSGDVGSVFLQNLPTINYYPGFMTLISLLTICSGIWIMYIHSSGFRIDYLSSKLGMSYLAGGILACLVFSIGFFIIRPSGLKIAKLGSQLTEGNSQVVSDKLKEMNTFKNRIVNASKVAALILVIIILLMTMARFI